MDLKKIDNETADHVIDLIDTLINTPIKSMKTSQINIQANNDDNNNNNNNDNKKNQHFPVNQNEAINKDNNKNIIEPVKNIPNKINIQTNNGKNKADLMRNIPNKINIQANNRKNDSIFIIEKPTEIQTSDKQTNLNFNKNMQNKIHMKKNLISDSSDDKPIIIGDLSKHEQIYISDKFIPIGFDDNTTEIDNYMVNFRNRKNNFIESYGDENNNNNNNNNNNIDDTKHISDNITEKNISGNITDKNVQNTKKKNKSKTNRKKKIEPDSKIDSIIDESKKYNKKSKNKEIQPINQKSSKKKISQRNTKVKESPIQYKYYDKYNKYDEHNKELNKQSNKRSIDMNKINIENKPLDDRRFDIDELDIKSGGIHKVDLASDIQNITKELPENMIFDVKQNLEQVQKYIQNNKYDILANIINYLIIIIDVFNKIIYQVLNLVQQKIIGNENNFFNNFKSYHNNVIFNFMKKIGDHILNIFGKFGENKKFLTIWNEYKKQSDSNEKEMVLLTYLEKNGIYIDKEKIKTITLHELVELLKHNSSI